MLQLHLFNYVAHCTSNIVSQAIPQITTDFHSLEDVGWYGAAYNFCRSVFQPSHMPR